MTKGRKTIFLAPETDLALTEYARRHRDRFRTPSAAVDHLLHRALLSDLDEGQEGVLAPVIARIVREAAEHSIAGSMALLLATQTDRLASLLVRADRDSVAAGKDAATAAILTEAVLAQMLGERARDVAADARLKAGAKYARREWTSAKEG